MFSIALPIAPFLAMINNLFELRTDAIKLLFELRRPIGEFAYTLSIWEKIVDALSNFYINDLDDQDEILQGKQLNITYCRYRDFRYDYGNSISIFLLI
jgi:hypothetical protein